eukprot:TRINITY_DN19552_c0_g1_i1.p1 TRINITY_DN19552_c0_g1~~TRINITY_DN19552_c0_g1_i1.p1  ORF type:complete len:334 (-),score=119.45 TRINITY_DN19552_c0_g1_i1:606-1607(-)
MIKMSVKKPRPSSPTENTALIDAGKIGVNGIHGTTGNVVMDEKPAVQPLLPLLGELLVFIDVLMFIFMIFLSLKLSHTVDWTWWAIFAPGYAMLLVLVLMTQSKRFTKRASLLIRLAWLMSTLTLACFLLMLNLYLDYVDIAVLAPIFKHFSLSMIFIPLWVMLGVTLVFGVASLGFACANSDEDKRRKHIIAGVPLLFFAIFFGPFLIMLELRVTGADTVAWSSVFIPLWVFDGISLIFGVCLAVYTPGGSEGAVFTTAQVSCFLTVLPCSVVFKVLLVLVLEQVDGIQFFYTMIPLSVMQVLLFACGLDMRLRVGHHGQTKPPKASPTQLP